MSHVTEGRMNSREPSLSTTRLIRRDLYLPGIRHPLFLILIQGPPRRPIRTHMHHNITANTALEARLVLPATRLHIRILTHTVLAPGARAVVARHVPDIEPDAAFEQGAEHWVLGAGVDVAVDGAEVVPEFVFRGLEAVLDLHDTGGGVFVFGQVADLEGEAAAEAFGVFHEMGDGGASGDFGAKGVVVLSEEGGG